MAELVINKTIKMILAVLLITVVIVGLFLFFSNSVFSFFKNLPGGNETQDSLEGDSSSTNKDTQKTKPEESCSDCGFFCSKEDCQEISDKWEAYSKGEISCVFEDNFLINDCIEKID